MERLEKLFNERYPDREMSVYVNESTVVQFMNESMYKTRIIKVIVDPRKLQQECRTLMRYLNKYDGYQYPGTLTTEQN